MSEELGEDLGALGADLWRDIAKDEPAREACERIIADVGVVAKRVGEVWPGYVGRLVRLTMRAALQ